MKALVAILGLAAVGCSASFDRAAMSDQLWEGEKVFTDGDVARIEQLRPQLTLPFRLAIAPPLREDWYGAGGGSADVAEIRSWFDPLVEAGIVSEVVVLPRILVGSSRTPDYTKAVRVAAARVQADAVLLLSTVTELDGYQNALSILNLTVVGLWCVPTQVREALTLVEGIVLDNRNEYVYWTGAAEGSGRTTGPVLGGDPKDAIRESRRNALQSFGKLLAKDGVRLKSGPPGPRYGSPGR